VPQQTGPIYRGKGHVRCVADSSPLKLDRLQPNEQLRSPSRHVCGSYRPKLLHKATPMPYAVKAGKARV